MSVFPIIKRLIIYESRQWRGGDLSILQSKIKEDVNPLLSETHSLDRNFRSAGNIVRFNNALFETASKALSVSVGTNFPMEAYRDAQQEVVVNDSQGLVRIQFLAQLEEESSFEKEALQLLPKLLEELQEKGVVIKDIAFLVRENSQGRLIADRFMEYRASPERKPDLKYDVVSNESLQLDRATSVVILINALRVLDNPAHQIAKAHLAYEYQKLWPARAFMDWNEIFLNSKEKLFAKWVPLSFIQQQNRLISLPLFEMVENLIHIFSLGKLTDEVIYLQAFQDLILEFSQREKNDLTSFLEWWEINKTTKSVQVADDVEAAQIVTVHKSKGLQFKYVIIPFLQWELGHGSKGPMLWSKSNHPVFKEAGYIPVNYKNDLDRTVFKEDYFEEKNRVHLDNLNLLYVAFTRAESGLIAFAPQPKNKAMAHVGQLVHHAIGSNLFLQGFWSEASQLFQYGEIIPSTPGEKIMNTTSLAQYVVTPWRERLQVRASGIEFFEPTQQRKKINYGIFLHGILSQIRVANDAKDAIERAHKAGKIAESEIEEVTQLIQWVVTHPQLSNLFNQQARCKMEAVILGADGVERRIDRLAFQGTKTWLLDYKTGNPSSQDELQVKDYLKLLRAMGKEEVTGFLVYVQERKCIEVKI